MIAAIGGNDKLRF